MHMAPAAGEWTVADLATLPHDGNRYEVVDGELLVTPAPTIDHQDAIGRLYRLLASYLDTHRVGAAIVAPADVTFSPRRVCSLTSSSYLFSPAAGRRSLPTSDI